MTNNNHIVIYPERECFYPFLAVNVTQEQLVEFKQQFDESEYSGVYSVCEYFVRGKAIYLIDCSTTSGRDAIYRYWTEFKSALIAD